VSTCASPGVSEHAQIAAFGRLVGQSFEVQSLIAVVNTILTTLGLVLLKIPGYGFMSLLVLVTSFIPVFGVFISTLPMALVALTEYGVGKMLDVILMVIGVHVVEVRLLTHVPLAWAGAPPH
jgi:predicted PurR-regulated permease PerM